MKKNNYKYSGPIPLNLKVGLIAFSIIYLFLLTVLIYTLANMQWTYNKKQMSKQYLRSYKVYVPYDQIKFTNDSLKITARFNDLVLYEINK